jgi:hypothetical protein
MNLYEVQQKNLSLVLNLLATKHQSHVLLGGIPASPVNILWKDLKDMEGHISDIHTIFKILENPLGVQIAHFYDYVNGEENEMLLDVELRTVIKVIFPEDFKIRFEKESKRLAAGDYSGDSRKKVYWLSKNGRKLILNDTYVLARPRFNSPNDLFIDALLSSPNTHLQRDVIKKKMNLKAELRRFQDMAKDLELLPKLKPIFFIGISEKGVHFRNPVYESDIAAIPKKQLQNIDIFVKGLSKNKS